MITMTFYAPTIQARPIQVLVGRYDGYFERNPLEVWNGDSQYCISFEDVKNSNKFSACLRIIDEPFY